MIYSKKVLSLILTALMVQSIFVTGGTVTASSYETTQESSYAQVQTAESKSAGDFTYSVENNGVKILKYTGTDTEVTIPNKIENLPVTAIGDYAFSDCHDIIGVEVPDTVTDMGSWTFCNCENLQVVNIPNGVTRLRERLFLNCYSLVQVNIPETVTVLEGWCFERCDSITSITIPDSVTEICESAFLNAKGLKTVNIPHSVTKIWNYAFCGTALENITIPNSITEIGIMLFENCTSLKTVTLENGITNIGQMLRKSSIKTITLPESMTYLSNSAFEDCLYLSEVNLPSKLETIDNYAFWNCDALTTINIPETVTKIGYQVFGRCDNLSSVTIPKNVTDIGGMWFVETPNLKTVTFEEGTTKIGNALQHSCIESFDFPASLETLSQYAFANCNNLTSMTIPDTVKQIDGWTFSECENLETVVLPNTIQNIPERMFLRCHSLTSVNIPASVKSLDGWCFEECTSFTSFTIPDTVNTIHNQVFQYCSGLKTVTIPNSVTELENELFKGCTSLEQITIPRSVTKLGDRIFCNCTSLESVTIPDSVTEFGGFLFEGCTAFKTATFENGITNIGQMFRNSYIETITLPESMTYLSNSAFEDCIYLSEVNLPSNLETIDNYAFWNCDALTTINIPESVTKIGYQVFERCDNLSSVTIPKNVTDIGGMWFVETPNLKTVTFEEGTTKIGNALQNSCIESFDFPASLETLNQFAFANCNNLTFITIPDTVKQIDGWTFSECENLETVVLPNTIQNIPERMFLRCHSLTNVNIPASVKSLDGWCFEECTSFTSFTIPDTVNTIHNQVFQYCSGLKTVTIPNSVTELENELFNGCTSLEQITIPHSVTKLGDRIFCNCTSLENITIPDSVTEFGGCIFEGCTALKTATLENGITNIGQMFRNSYIETITLPESMTYLSNSAFEECRNLKSVTLPDNLETIDRYAFYKCESLEDITIPDKVQKIDYQTFLNAGLKTVTLPANLNLIDTDAFAGCTGLEKVYYRNTVANWGNNVTVNDGNECLGGISSNAEMYFFPDTLTLNKTSYRMDFEDTYNLKYTFAPQNSFGKYTWKSSNSSVVKVTQSGKITAVNEGTANITVTHESGLKAVCKVTVNPVPKTLELDKDTLTLFTDDTYTLQKSFTPSDAKAKYTWSSSDTQVAAVDSDGKVTAISAGTATITLRSNNGLTATCDVTVWRYPDSVSLDKTSIETGEGLTEQLTPQLSPDDSHTKSFTWTSSDENIATVSQDGLVTAVRKGTATIKVTTSNGKSAQCVVTVKELPQSVKLSKSSTLIKVGSTERIKATITPSDAYNEGYTWKSSDKTIAAVSSTGLITAKKAGIATITYRTANGKTAKCTVTVVNVPESVAISKTSLTLAKGGTEQLSKAVTPEDADAYTSYTWTSSNESVASVSENGFITAKEVGTATVTVTTDNGKSASCTVEVRPAAQSISLDKTETVIKVGTTQQLTQTVTPSTAYTSYKWSSSDPDVVSVSESGVITANSTGTAVITVETDNGKSASCTVTSKEVESVDLNKHSMTLGVGQAYTLRPSTTPDDIESTFTWKSSNKDVATVTSKGKVTGRAVGKATITVRTDNGKICTCTVVVKQAPKDISLNKTEMTLGTGQMYTLQSTLTPSNSATYQQWTSSDTSVAVVNANGRVTAKKVGTAVITVKTTNNHTATCTVTVKKAPTSVALNKTAINVGVGQKYTLTAELTPTDSATYCMWSSDDTEIAEVNSNGVVTGKAAGTANITVKTTNGKTATCKVTVKKAPTAIELDKTSLSMKVKETYTLVKTLTPTNSAASYIWSSSDTTVATVSSVGKVTAKKAGTAIITVTTHNGKTASCTVEVR